LNELPTLISKECIDFVCVNFEQSIEFSKENEVIFFFNINKIKLKILKVTNFITTMAALNLKISLNDQLNPQKYLVICFSDGRLCFYSIFNDSKRLKVHRVFLCYNANEGLPYLINSPNSNVDRSISDPNYKLKIPLAVKKNILRFMLILLS